MKDNFKKTLSVISRTKSFLALRIAGNKSNTVGLPAMFYNSMYSLKGTHNSLKISGQVIKSDFFIDGTQNQIALENTEIGNTIITVVGDNNSVQCEKGVILRNAVITIRGQGCNIKIGKATTFGGVRIINVGKNNDVIIGAECLFSDFIEIWASDTHPIYNEQHEIINPEKSIHIEDNVWVGARAIILKGVTIASGSVVGMGSLVVNNVPKAAITAGSPNRIIKNNITWSRHY